MTSSSWPPKCLGKKIHQRSLILLMPMLDRTLPPAFRPITGFVLVRSRPATFGNGVKLFVFREGTQDLVRIEWVFNNVFERESQGLLNMAVNELMLEGTSAYSSAQIAELVDFHGAFLVPQFGYDQSTLTLFSLNK